VLAAPLGAAAKSRKAGHALLVKNMLRKVLFALLLAGVTGLLAGCVTDQPPDPKPWLPPQNWEGPMPSNMNQGR